MNNETLTEIITKLNNLQNQMDDMSKVVNGLKIDSQSYIKSDIKLTPGIACKVAYNKDGVIIKTSKLESSDIPNISIDQVIGLRDQLKSNNSNKTINTDDILKRSSIYGTGCKVNYDNHGLIINSTELNVEDIPEIPISKITGLQDILDELKSTPNNVLVDNHQSVVPSTGCKITYDDKGHIQSSTVLSLSDIPNELICKINKVESNLTNLASQESVNIINKRINSKVESNNPIDPGVYTKVYVDSKGLITKGEMLTISDLPKITINDIEGLTTELHDKISIEQYNNLRDELTIYMNSINMSKINSAINDAIKNKISIDKYYYLENNIKNIYQKLDEINSRLLSLESPLISIE